MNNYTPQQIEQVCAESNYSLALPEIQHNGKIAIICGAYNPGCKYAKVNGIILCSKVHEASTLENLFDPDKLSA